MWISKQLAQKDKQVVATSAQVTLAQNNSVCTAGSAENRFVPIYAPFGIESLPPLGTQVLLIESEDATVCAGSLCNAQNVQEGEIRLFSKGGAYIILKNSGDIVLNGLTITKDGQIKQTGV